MAKIVLIGNYALINYLLRFDLNVMKKCALFFGTMQQGGCVCVCCLSHGEPVAKRTNVN